MRKNKYLYIFTFILLCLFSFFKLSNVYAQGKEFTVDSILINNEEINIKDGCDLKLKYNDVIRITGRNTPKSEVTLLFADQEYTTQTDDNGYWMILISVPYIEDGKYEIVQKENNKIYCNVTLKSSENEMNEETDIKENTPIYIYVISAILFLSIGLYIFLFKRKKQRK
jgi:hypothetical protein